MNWAIISLIGLIVIIVIANVKNINVGIVGLAMAFFIGTMGGMKLKNIYNSFNLQIFLRMMGMQVLIVIARNNGTLNILGNLVLKAAKGKAIRLLPIILYFGIGVASWFQLGLSNVLTPLIFAMAFELGFKDPFKLGFVTFFTMFAWGISPYSMQGLNIAAYAEEQGYALNLWHGAFNMALMGTVLFIALYLYHGWHKMEPISLKEREQVKLVRDQILTLVGFVTFIICNLFLKIDMMVTPICAGVVLLCLGCGDPDKVVRGIPWSTLIMIGGMTVYVGVISGFGGVELISTGIAAVANRAIAPAVMTMICGVMSLFSSGNGVVIPTMSATISSLAESIPGLNISTMFWAVVIGANATAISPMSTIGANSMAYYSACYSPTEKENKKSFNKLFLYAGLFLVWASVASSLGIVSIFK